MHNLFLCGEGEAKTPRAVRALCKAVHKIDADIWMLQEVGSIESLTALNSQLKRPYPYLDCIPGNSNRGIHLGVLSRHPIFARSHRDTPLCNDDGDPLWCFNDAVAAFEEKRSPVRLQRDVLRVDSGGITLFGVHLKSKGNPAWQCVSADEIRYLEAKVVAQLAGEYHREHLHAKLLLLGDFNDVANSESLQPITALEWCDPHANMFAELGRNPSTYWPKRRMRLDRVLVNPETVPQIVSGSVQLHSGELFRRASDHYPVTLELR